MIYHFLPGNSWTPSLILYFLLAQTWSLLKDKFHFASPFFSNYLYLSFMIDIPSELFFPFGLCPSYTQNHCSNTFISLFVLFSYIYPLLRASRCVCLPVCLSLSTAASSRIPLKWERPGKFTHLQSRINSFNKTQLLVSSSPLCRV